MRESVCVAVLCSGWLGNLLQRPSSRQQLAEGNGKPDSKAEGNSPVALVRFSSRAAWLTAYISGDLLFLRFWRVGEDEAE